MGTFHTQGMCEEQTEKTESLLLKELQPVVIPYAGAGTTKEQDKWNPYAQGNWKLWALSDRNHNTWDGRKHYAHCLNFLCCLMAHQVNSDRQSVPHSENKGS